ncbi:glycoside hydrolase family 9 protein [Heliophilum fasciatum]|uniref:Concanavalin A-like lectin/glucanase superfamily protein n=1 Tax=Heliophilum fasciatum TaxID=35700 RepID=A0A4R2RQ90_9FIRM|nr:glycoside hydrolase family 9 protein [Heliophilum fasciatum]MCW2277863.1 hypothetical protein [Heliophilum fasciatum]TCP64567.1 concanavalin A-like lectin/glucanase superfamily protein [Heliophilum fasciatum]
MDPMKRRWLCLMLAILFSVFNLPIRYPAEPVGCANAQVRQADPVSLSSDPTASALQSSVPPTMPQGELIAYYPLDGNFNDASGNGYHLTPLMTDPPFSTEYQIRESNRCFGPVADGRLHGAASDRLPADVSKSLTVAGFARKVNSSNQIFGTIFGFSSENWTESTIGLKTSWGMVTASSGDIRTGIQLGRCLDTDAWYHLALVVDPVDPTTNTQTYRAYINGELKEVKAYQKYGPVDAFYISAIEGASNYINFYVDEVYVYGRALAPTEIQNLAVINNPNGPPPPNSGIRARKIPKDLTVQGKLRIYPITNEWICVTGDYNDFLRERFHDEFGDYLSYIDKLYVKDAASVNNWTVYKPYLSCLQEILFAYRPQIKKNFEDPAFFTVQELSGDGSGNAGDSAARPQALFAYQPKNPNNGEEAAFFRFRELPGSGTSATPEENPVAIVNQGYWLQAIGRFPYYTQTARYTVHNWGNTNGELIHYAFIKLEKPLVEGKTYRINTKNNEQATFQYREQDLISRAIKVNQVGYMPDAGKKYAYLGLWMGTAGALELPALVGQPFYLISNGTGTIKYTGTVQPRFTADNPVQDNFFPDQVPLTGEKVYQLDFSDFKEPGHYYIYVPGVGRSWDFRINDDVMGEAFYLHAKGLYHQRSGTDKVAPYTNWTVDEPDYHRLTYKANFIAYHTDQAYPARTDQYGFRNEKGEPIEKPITPFTVISESATNELVEGVWGGWRDAADGDRRPHHFGIVQSLLTAYLMFPEKFTDGQLNIPESGNGIPDIIDEATWGVDVWRRAQNEKGGVGCWIEAESHQNKQWYLAQPTKISTMQYAAHAALLARVYRMVYERDPRLTEALAQSRLFYASAKKAYEYALNPENVLTFSWNHKKDDGTMAVYSYIEPPDEVEPGYIFKAALNLYYLAQDQAEKAVYLQALNANEAGFTNEVLQMHWRLSPYTFFEIVLSKDEGDPFAAWVQYYRDRILKNNLPATALGLLEQQEKDPYRFTNRFTPSVPARWGLSNAYRYGQPLLIAYYLTKDTDKQAAEKYRNAALNLVDFQNGANSMGKSWTTSLGHVYPLRIQHHDALPDNGYYEPVPGISIYGIIGDTPINGKFSYVQSISYGGQYQSMLPDAWSGGNDQLSLSEIKQILLSKMPVWHRYWNIEDAIVDCNEFTVHETIGPSIIFTGALLPDGWMPSEELKNRKPMTTKEEMEKHPGYVFMP